MVQQASNELITSKATHCTGTLSTIDCLTGLLCVVLSESKCLFSWTCHQLLLQQYSCLHQTERAVWRKEEAGS